MPKAPPDYRTDVLACPLSPGKLGSVVELVLAMRSCARKEACLQWQQFFERGWNGFEATARQGWTRPWVADGTLATSHAQMVMALLEMRAPGAAVEQLYVQARHPLALPPARSVRFP